MHPRPLQLAVFCLVWLAARQGSAGPLSFGADGHTVYGDWHADITVSAGTWQPGIPLDLEVRFRFPSTQLAAMAAAGISADRLCVLVTAERTFDATGWMRLASDERMSTLLTPAGLAIEGGIQGAVTSRYGYQFTAPVDQFQSVLATTAQPGGVDGTLAVTFAVHTTLAAALPPGLYRLRFDFGVMAGTRLYNINGFTFASRPFSDQAGTLSYIYSTIIEASGPDVAGRPVDGAQIRPRMPWLLLSKSNSNGSYGTVADEDAPRFALSNRNLIADEVILPRYSDSGWAYPYSLEPVFAPDSIDPDSNIKWNWTSGALTVVITNPDGTTTNLGTSAFVGGTTGAPTTNVAALTAWKPPMYGRYTVTATGWIADVDGRRYDGGGTYHFWIAKRMTLATATFQGMAYPVGASYGRDIQFNPPLPAQVEVTATLYPDSDAAAARSLSYAGRASSLGIFGAAQGMRPFPLDAPGEYHAKILATHVDPEGHLWVCAMRHAGIVYSDASTVLARGKKISVDGKYVERGETNTEGYIEANGTQHLQHIAFPYQSGDVLEIAAEGQSANKIEPVLIYQMQGDTSPWDTKLNGVGTTNLRIKTFIGYSPHQFPEYITDIEYYYGAAPRPGFMGRFIVAESTVRAPYWAVSPNSFGGQVGASSNGDAPGDIYRLIGGVALRRVGQAPLYAGYLSSAFLLPKGTNNNRIVAAGAEDVRGPLGTLGRFFLVGLRPGTAYEAGGSFRPAVQIDPVLPAAIHFVLTYPDGRQQVADGTGDRFGSYAGPTWTLDVPGIYTYQLSATWNGYTGTMPGLPDSGGRFFVYSRTRPPSAAGLRVDGPSQRAVSASTGATITGSSTATSVAYTLIMPGAVIEQGELPVLDGKFTYVFDPAAVHAKVPLYDIVNNTTGAPQVGRVLHLTFFSQEVNAAGAFYDSARVILRGTSMNSPRELLPNAPLLTLGVVRSGGGTVTISGAGAPYVCGTCLEPYRTGSVLTLAAGPSDGSVFLGWTGACSGTAACTVTMDSAKSVGAMFQRANVTLPAFEDDPLRPALLFVKAVHVAELRQRINDLRGRRGLQAFSWTDPDLAPGVTAVRGVHLTELRTAINEVYTKLGWPLPVFSTPTIAAGMTIITAAHVAELRLAVDAAW
jgi:hypothetical protein